MCEKYSKSFSVVFYTLTLCSPIFIFSVEIGSVYNQNLYYSGLYIYLYVYIYQIVLN